MKKIVILFVFLSMLMSVGFVYGDVDCSDRTIHGLCFLQTTQSDCEDACQAGESGGPCVWNPGGINDCEIGGDACQAGTCGDTTTTTEVPEFKSGRVLGFVIVLVAVILLAVVLLKKK